MADELTHMDQVKKVADQYFEAVEEDVSVSFASEIYSLISNNPQLSILTLVEALSTSLTHENVNIRFKATKLLAEYLHTCQPGDLNNRENETLISFFCDRLLDHHSIQPLVVYGFLGLISYQNTKQESVIKMLQRFFAEVHVQSLTHSDRHNVFNLFKNLLEIHLDVLRNMSADFVLGFIQAMDSERDPRNLLVCFANAHVVLREIDTSLFIEDFFEILSCYFPIDFTPPKDNHHGITKHALVTSLRKCLTCCKSFAPFAVPLYVEKLSSDVMAAKIESLVTLTECLAIYSSEDVEPFSKDIWMLIRKDFLLSDTVELHDLYLKFTTALVACFLKSGNKDTLRNLVDSLIADCLQTLKDPDMTIAVPCGELIYTMSSLSADVLCRVIEKLLDPLETSLSKYSSHGQRTSLFEIVCKIVQVDVCVFAAITTGSVLSKMVAFFDKHLSMAYSFLTYSDSSALQSLGLKFLTEILKKRSKLSLNCNIDTLSQHVFKMVSSTVMTAGVFDDMKCTVRELSIEFNELVDLNYISPLIDAIPEENIRTDVFQQCLYLLQSCCSVQFKRFGGRVLSYLLNTMFITLRTENEIVFTVSSKCCVNILNERQDTMDGSVMVDPLIQKLLTCDLVSSRAIYLEGFMTVLTACYRRLPVDQQYTVLQNSCELTQKKGIYANHIIKGTYTNQNFPQVLSILAVGVVCQVDNPLLKKIDRMNLLLALWGFMKEHAGSDVLVEYAGLCIACVLNKVEKDCEILQPMFDIVIQEKELGVAVDLLTWITKAFVLNWRKDTRPAIEQLVTFLNDKSHGSRTTRAFEILVREETLALTRSSNAIVKLMHKQRFSQLVLPLLIDGYGKCDEETKANFMSAISCVLQIIPKQFLKDHLKKLLPLLMHSLATCYNHNILQSTLTTLSGVLDHNKDTVHEYVETMATRLLSLVTHSNMNIRIVVLKCLTSVSYYPSYQIVPIKPQVLRRLRAVLDDKKRLVRKEAIRCSNAWYMMDM